jgi:hypothetical protein
MKFLNKSRMFWIWIVSAAIAALAILSAFLQYREDEHKKTQESAKRNEDLNNMRELKDAYKTIHELDSALADKSDTIIIMQGDQKRELNEKTGEIIALQTQLNEKNEQLMKQQKEALNYATGGDTLIRLLPNMGFTNSSGHFHIELRILNQSPYPQYEVRVFISDGFKYQMLEKKKDTMNPFAFFDRAAKETTSSYIFGTIEAGGERLIYETDLPNELNKGRFLVAVECRNGSYHKEVFYKKENGFWELVDAEKWYTERPFTN